MPPLNRQTLTFVLIGVAVVLIIGAIAVGSRHTPGSTTKQSPGAKATSVPAQSQDRPGTPVPSSGSTSQPSKATPVPGSATPFPPNPPAGSGGSLPPTASPAP